MFAMAFFIIGTVICIYVILLAGAAIVTLVMAAGVVGCAVAAVTVVGIGLVALFGPPIGALLHLADDYHLPPFVAGCAAVLSAAVVWRIILYLRDR